MPGQDYDFAIVGCGRIAKNHMNAIREHHDRAELVGACDVDPRALDELLPDWRETCPLAEVPVTENHHWVLSETGKWALPHLFMPPLMSNKGTYTGSLGMLCRWLAEQAEALGVEVYPGMAASAPVFEDDRLVGVVVGEFFGSSVGLGYMIASAATNYKVDVVFVGVAIFMALSVTLTLVVKHVESRLASWRPEMAKSF